MGFIVLIAEKSFPVVSCDVCVFLLEIRISIQLNCQGEVPKPTQNKGFDSQPTWFWTQEKRKRKKKEKEKGILEPA
jgi:hypothetical protein